MFGNDDDGKVGYGRPPKHTRFKKGQSGNPRGRPKRSRNLQSALVRVVAEPVNVRVGDKVKTVPGVEALALAMLGSAIKGNARAMAWIEDRLPVEQVQEEKPAEPSAEAVEARKEINARVRRLAPDFFEQRDRIAAACRTLREQGISEQLINDLNGVSWMDHEERDRRRAMAEKAIHAKGVPYDIIDVASGRAFKPEVIIGGGSTPEQKMGADTRITK
jgi:hypothetical protein